jgi:SAM-dependent methyltransferase
MAYALPDTPLFARTCQEIHPDCEMYGYARRMHGEEEARAYYFSSGLHLVGHLQRFFEARGLRTEELSLLDFAAGYGRFTRYFVQLFREVVVSDLEPQMLDFAERCFGTPGFLSTTDPEQLAIDRRFDAVFCFSLFTHLPEAPWRAWLRRLADLVEPGGHLLFSTRSPGLARSLRASTLARPPQLAVSAPGVPELRRELTVFGLRLSAPANSEGSIELRMEVAAAAPWWVEAPRAAAECPAPGLRIGPVSAEPLGPPGAWNALALRVPFQTTKPVSDVPLGPILATLRSLEPDCPLVGPSDGRPQASLSLDAGEVADFAFEPTNETAGRLEVGSYGSTTVSHEWVCRAADALGTLELAAHFGRGEFDYFQDVYAFRRR